MATADESVLIETAEDGQSFTVRDNPDYTTPPVSYTAEPMSKSEVVGLSLFGAACLAAIGAVGWFGYKADKRLEAEAAEKQAEMKRKREERQEWFDTQRREGRTVIETRNGEYLSIDNEAYAKAEIRKKAI